MIKIALKHWIYELCIEQIFTNIQKNFIFKYYNPWKIKAGEYYSKVYVRHPKCFLELSRCLIKDTLEGTARIRIQHYKEYNYHSPNEIVAENNFGEDTKCDLRINIEEICEVAK